MPSRPSTSPSAPARKKKLAGKKKKPAQSRKSSSKKGAAEDCRKVTKTVRGRRRKVEVCKPKARAKPGTTSAAKPPPFTFAPAPAPVLEPAAPGETTSPELPPPATTPITPDPPPPATTTPPQVSDPLTAARAERLLWRTGFGPRPGQVDALVGRSLEAVVEEITSPSSTTYSGPAPTVDGAPLSPDDLWGHDHLEWFDRMVRADNPLVERMTLIWHDWFATTNDGVGNQRLMRVQNQTLRENCLGGFDALLRAVTIDPAMLTFLNGIDNNKWHPNENYAREVMELFTLGAERGAYTETDIREAARGLTGWRATWTDGVGLHDFRYDPRRHDTGSKTVFGKTGAYGWEDILRLCTGHDLHASFFVSKLWSYFVPVPPDSATLASLQGLYLSTGRQIRPVVKAILKHPAFLDGPGMVVPPVVHSAALLRATGQGITTDAWSWIAELAGQRLYYPPNVSGWDDSRWLDTSSSRGRWYAATWALHKDHIDPWPDGGSDYDKTESTQAAIDRALELLARPTLSAECLAVLRDFSDGVEGSITATWQRSPWHVMRQNALRMLIATSPDFNVC